MKKYYLHGALADTAAAAVLHVTACTGAVSRHFQAPFNKPSAIHAACLEKELH
jgi:hypothetical protein